MKLDEIKLKTANLLTPYANEMEDERLGIFLSLAVGRISLNHFNKNNKYLEIETKDLRHITDWLKASIINNEDWLANVDDQNRPKKLMKFSKIEQIIKEADKAMTKASQRASGINLIEGDEVLHSKLDDGYYIVKLLTPAALDRESSEMQHCIGQGAYDRKLNNNSFQYLSLRDASGKAHVTLEIEDNLVQQCQGKQNQVPIKKYLDLMRNFIIDQKYSVNRSLSFDMGYVIDVNQKWHSIYDLPEGLIIDHTFKIKRGFNGRDIKLPKNLTIMGDMIIEETNVEELPIGLKVHGFLDISYNPIKVIPADLWIKEDFVLNDTLIEEFPAGITFNGNLELWNCFHLKKLPDNLFVADCLFLHDSTALKELPSNLIVKEGLYLDDTIIENLPEDIQVGGSLSIISGKVRKLPASLTNLNELNANSSDLEDISHLKEVKGLLNINNTKVKILPKGLKVGKDLDISDTDIESMEGITVRGSLFATGSRLSKINNAKYQNLSLSRSLINELPENLYVDGFLDLSNVPKLTELPKGLKVKTGLSLVGSEVSILCDNLQVGGDLRLNNSNVCKLPQGLNVNLTLSLCDTDVHELPDDLEVGEAIKIDEHQLDYIPVTVRDDLIIYERDLNNDNERELTVGEYRTRLLNNSVNYK